MLLAFRHSFHVFQAGLVDPADKLAHALVILARRRIVRHLALELALPAEHRGAGLLALADPDGGRVVRQRQGRIADDLVAIAHLLFAVGGELLVELRAAVLQREFAHGTLLPVCALGDLVVGKCRVPLVQAVPVLDQVPHGRRAGLDGDALVDGQRRPLGSGHRRHRQEQRQGKHCKPLRCVHWDLRWMVGKIPGRIDSVRRGQYSCRPPGVISTYVVSQDAPRRWPCRYEPALSPRRWPTPGPPTCPSTTCPAQCRDWRSHREARALPENGGAGVPRRRWALEWPSARAAAARAGPPPTLPAPGPPRGQPRFCSLHR